MIDNSPTAKAIEEGEADARARARPFEKAGASSKSELYHHARTAGKIVIRCAREAGVPDSEIAAMKKRMAKWVNVVVSYRRDIDALWKMDMPQPKKVAMVAELVEMRDKLRVEMFGA